MRVAGESDALFSPFALAGKRLRNRITHASMSLLATTQYHADRAAGGAAMTGIQPLLMRYQDGQPRVQAWRRDDPDGLKRFA